MARMKWVDGQQVQMTPTEEAAFLASLPAPLAIPLRIEWGALIRAMTSQEATQFDAAVEAAEPRFRWLIQKTAYIATDDPDYPTLKAAFDAAYGKPRSDALLPAVGAVAQSPP